MSRLKVSKLTDDQKKVRTERKVTDYQDMTHHTHIFKKPGTYVGSIRDIERDDFIYDEESKSIVAKKISICEGILRLLLEILSNVGDNADDSRRMGILAGDIKMWMTNEKVTVRSSGKPLPVVPKQEKSTPEHCYTLVQHIFGVLLTSSHYDETVKRYSCGTNGYGAKLVNIFSKWFSVKVGDPERGQEHESVWENNMSDYVKSETTPGFIYKDEPCEVVIKGQNEQEEDTIIKMPGTWINKPTKIGKYKGESYVEVSWILDFERFGKECYPEEAFGLLKRCLLDFGLSSKLKVSFNDEEFDCRDIKDYAKLAGFSEEEVKSSVLHYEWEGNEIPEELSNLKKAALEKQIKECKTANCIPTIEMLILDTPDNARCLSYVNGLMTPEGGVHVDAAFDIILHEILEKFDLTKKKKGKDDDKKKVEEKKKKVDDKKKPKLTIRDVRPHVSMILVCRLVNTDYTSQSKTKLSHPTPTYSLKTSNVFEQMNKWQLKHRLIAALDAKNFNEFNKNNSNKRSKVYGGKGERANKAGTKESLDCIFCITEGDSATCYVEKRLVILGEKFPDGKTGQNYIGYMPLGGKPLNALKADLTKVGAHTTFNGIMKYMGLSYGVDYSIPANKNQLNYGFLLAICDADVDGYSILCLIIAWLYKFFPSILTCGMFGYLITPAVKLMDKKGKNAKIMHRFDSEDDYEKWLINNKNHGYYPKYFKGLASSEDDDIEDDLDTATTIIMVYDDDSKESLETAFGKDIKARKEWIIKWREVTRIKDVQPISLKNLLRKKQTIKNVIDTSLIDFTLDAFLRAIPNYRDGLKKAQRQALWYVLNKWSYGTGSGEHSAVARVSAAAAEMTHYHHGEDSLSKTIIWMAQNYIGSNNLNFFYQNGQFGSRKGNEKGIGKNFGSPRYIKTSPEWWIKYLYSKEMILLMDKNIVEDEEVEPVIIPCKLPIHVINGYEGLSTGWSTSGCCHNPLDTIDWIVTKCKGGKPTELFPWYGDFTGKIRKVIIKPRNKSRLNFRKKEEEDLPEESDDEYTKEDLGKDDEVNDDEEEEEEIDYKRISIKTEGVFEILKFDAKKNTADILITEIPIGVGTYVYRKMLEELIPLKKLKDLISNTTDKTFNKIHITLEGLVLDCPPESSDKARHTCLVKQLKMVTALKIHNMHLIDMKGFPVKYNSVEDVMNEYYNSMIDIYNLMIRKRIENSEKELLDLIMELKFITLLENGTIVTTKGTSKEDIMAQMTEYEIKHELGDKIKIWDATLKNIENYNNKIEKQKLKIIEIKKQVAEQLWIDDLEVFRKAYLKFRQKLTKESVKEKTKGSKKKIVKEDESDDE